jgi:hypothetical protein
MTGLSWTARLLSALAVTVLVVSSAAAATSPGPYPVRIDFPSTEFDPTGTATLGTGYSPEGIAVSGDTFYAGSTQTGEIIKGNLRTGELQRNWVPASPAPPDPNHRVFLGLLVDDHNRLWAAGALGTTGSGNVNAKGEIFVYDADSGALLAAYTILPTGVPKTMNDIAISDNAVWISDTAAPAGAGSETQFKLPLGPGGALPPGGEVSGGVPAPTSTPTVVPVPTPTFTGADGIDVLPNGNIIVNSVNGASNGQMIVIDKTTLAVTPVTVSAGSPCVEGQCEPPLLSGDGVAIDGNTLYYPENRADTATPPGDIAAVDLMPPDFTTAQIVARLNNQPSLPRLRNPANTEQLGHVVYGITRELVANPVTGALNVNQFYVARIDKIPPPCSTSSAAGPVNVGATEAVCLSGSQAGAVRVQAGGTLYLDGASVTGSVTASSGASVHICGSHITGPLTVTGTTGAVVVGGEGCDANVVVGSATLTGNTGGVEFNGNTVIGSVRITGNSAPVHATGNTILGRSTIQQ